MPVRRRRRHYHHRMVRMRLDLLRNLPPDRPMVVVRKLVTVLPTPIVHWNSIDVVGSMVAYWRSTRVNDTDDHCSWYSLPFRNEMMMMTK